MSGVAEAGMRGAATDEGPARLKVALLADDFNPEWPSLPIVGFKYARALAEHADVTVFTHVRNRGNLDKLRDLRFAIRYLDNEYIAAPIFKLQNWLRGGDEVGWTIQIASKYLPYLEFERLALRGIKASGIAFDIVHRITPMSPTLPSLAAGRTEAPFVIGPLNGNLSWPRQFDEEQRREREWLNKFKGVYKSLPFLKRSYEKSAAILASFPHTIASLDKRYLPKVFDVPEIGYDEGIFYSKPRQRSERLTFLYAGRLVPYKLPETTVLAFAARPELRRHHLRIVGDGPERPRMEALVEQHALQDCVEFVGQRSQAEVADEMRRADIFFFPSIRELGAGVVIEALACGLPCLAADYGAPGSLVDDSRGRTVPIGTRAEMIEGFASAAVELANHPALDRMSQASVDYARLNFTWDSKAVHTLEIYEWVLGSRTTRPRFAY